SQNGGLTTLSGSTGGLALMDCALGQVLKSTGTNTWGCAGDDDTKYTKVDSGGWNIDKYPDGTWRGSYSGLWDIPIYGCEVLTPGNTTAGIHAKYLCQSAHLVTLPTGFNANSLTASLGAYHHYTANSSLASNVIRWEVAFIRHTTKNPDNTWSIYSSYIVREQTIGSLPTASTLGETFVLVTFHDRQVFFQASGTWL
ncbi:MAG: hypothetical protein LBC95_00240, partial [Candidatus Nomurabacteria bacterium]|nr:hypothetical protein [Candidatus Nomurabacteria bacterium]